MSNRRNSLSYPTEQGTRLTRRGRIALGAASVALIGSVLAVGTTEGLSYIDSQTAKADKLSSPTHAATPESIDSLPFMQAGPHKEFTNDGESAFQLATKAFPQDTNGRNPEKFAEDIALIANQGLASNGSLEPSQPIELPVTAQIGIEVDHP